MRMGLLRSKNFDYWVYYMDSDCAHDGRFWGVCAYK